MNILREMQKSMGMLPTYEKRNEAEVPKARSITGWIFKENKRPELTRVEASADAFARVLGTDEVEDISLESGLTVICEAGNWWKDGAYTFAVGDILIRGNVLIVGSSDEEFVSIPREAFNIDHVYEMCGQYAC